MKPHGDDPQNPVLFVYNGFMLLLWPFLFLYFLLRGLTDGKYRRSFLQRMGIVPPPRLPRSNHRVWVHALSVGEILSVVSLVKELRARCPGLEVVVSSATESGRKMAEDRLGADAALFLYLPHDFRWAVREAVDRIGPNLFVLVETDIWPNLPDVLRRSGIRTVLLNGRISPRSFRRLSLAPSFVSGIYSGFDLIFTQSEEDKRRYEAFVNQPGKVFAAGNLKFDAPAAEDPDPATLRAAAGIAGERQVWVGGSTHRGEEEILLDAHRSLMRESPGLLLILAPRQTARGPEILALCEKKGLTAAARSEGRTAQGKNVYVLDTLGELNRFYAVGDAAYIGGSMVAFGGHNPLEAVRWARPVVWGPHLFNFREIERELIAAGCGFRVSSTEELTATLSRCLGDSAFREKVGRAAVNFMASHSGISARIAEILVAGMRVSPKAP